MPTIDLHSRVVVATTQISCDLAGEAAILSLADGTYYGLDEVGAFVWNRLSAPISVADVCNAVCAAYDVEPATCHHDVLELLRQLQQRGLITVSDRSDAG